MIGHRRLSTALIALVTASLAMAAGAGVAVADEPSPPDSDSVVSANGEAVETTEYVLTPGAGPVGEIWTSDPPQPGEVTPLAEFGSSYARSTETAYLFYTGTAKAAANVFEGQRITRVTIQYNRLRFAGGPDEVVGPARSSFATCPNSFYAPGPEVTTTAMDSLGLNDPQTRFIIGTGRIPPTQRCG